MNKKILIIIIFISLFMPLTSVAQVDYKALRNEMVRTQIIQRGIIDRAVIAAMRKVERHLFVPEEVMSLAYNDYPLPIGEGQTISQPYIVALMSELLELNKNMKVLEIGTGSGYQAAILGEIAGEVYSIEIVEPLAVRSSQLLKRLGYTNVFCKTGDGYLGWKEYAPFDAIIVTCAPSEIPDPLKEQLSEGGRMIIPVGGQFVQELVLLTKRNGKVKQRRVAPVLFVPMMNNGGIRYQ